MTITFGIVGFILLWLILMVVAIVWFNPHDNG